MKTPAALIVALMLAAGPAWAGAKEEALEAWNVAIEDPFDDSAFEALLGRLPKLEDAYVVEGDLIMTRRQLRVHLAQISAERTELSAQFADSVTPELILHAPGGVPARWAQGQRTLSYAVARSSFPDQAKYQRVVDDMKAAAGAWKNICGECGIDFVHRAIHDGSPSQQDVTFIVSYVQQASFIAAAFFPNYPPQRRRVYIAASYFTTSFPTRGVLRHELGHTLGYRHEHTRGVRGCFFEDNQWLPLTPYDPHSVMHYLCGGAGNRRLEITQVDETGHRRAYAD